MPLQIQYPVTGLWMAQSEGYLVEEENHRMRNCYGIHDSYTSFSAQNIICPAMNHWSCTQLQDSQRHHARQPTHATAWLLSPLTINGSSRDTFWSSYTSLWQSKVTSLINTAWKTYQLLFRMQAIQLKDQRATACFRII